MKVGVLALQGTFIEHISMLRQLGVEAPQIRLPHEFNKLDGSYYPRRGKHYHAEANGEFWVD